MVVRRCPTSHPERAPAWQAGRGPDLERIRGALQDQHASAWLTLALLLVLDAASVSGVAYAALQGFIVFSALGFTALILVTARAVQRVRIARARLEQLARLDASLPRAIVHRR